MKVLLDENVAKKIKEGLISLGLNDVKHINDIHKGITDNQVFELANKEERVLITGDDDFKARGFKYKIPIIWITPKARTEKDICEKIKWILENAQKHNVKIQSAFIAIRKDEYFIEYKNKDGIFGKIKTLEINFDKISKKQKVKK